MAVLGAMLGAMFCNHVIVLACVALTTGLGGADLAPRSQAPNKLERGLL
jgi:hypothetical protein